MSMVPGVFVRPATHEDMATLADLGARTFRETFGHMYPGQDLEAFLSSARSETTYAGLVTDPGTLVALACSAQDSPLGYVVAGSCKLPVADLEPRAGEVRELYVLGSHQGRRVGSTLLEMALSWLSAEGRSPLYVGVWSENYGAQRLYGRHGFAKVGEYDFPVGRQLDREFILKRT